jgi:hypothetical protein
MKRFLSWLSVLLFAASWLPASALEWRTQQLVLKTVPLQRTAETAFDFTNNSGKTVKIVGLDTSCDCTEAAPNAQTFAPGASGRITARFTLGDRQGTYERTITVTTDETNEPVILRVQLDVPELATLTPRSVEWKLNSPAAERTVDLHVTDGLELTVDKVLPTSGLFACRLETVMPGRHYRLHLTPDSTREASNAAFRIYAKAMTGENVVFSAYGNVR